MKSSAHEAATYSRQFFGGQQAGSDQSARSVVSLVMRLLAPTSVVDFGCGVGAWLAAFEREGVTDVLGFDGDYVPRDMIQISHERFIATDLKSPPDVGRTFDLAISLEVAEHLPENASDSLVKTLCGLAPVVLFSAAIPLQGGTGHVNEQPQSYWAQKFAAQGFRAVDAIRPEIWHDEAVRFWYRQNILLYASEKALKADPALQRLEEATDKRMLDIVHPELLSHRNASPIITFGNFAQQWTRSKASRAKKMLLGKR